MTRVNLVEPEYLLDQHLMAEYREIPMVGAALGRTLKSKNGYDSTKVSDQYTLNQGHVYFFYNKADYLLSRYEKIKEELIERGFALDPNRTNAGWANFYLIEDKQISWKPNTTEILVNAARLHKRYLQKPQWYKYFGSSMPNYARFLFERYDKD